MSRIRHANKLGNKQKRESKKAYGLAVKIAKCFEEEEEN